MVNTNNKLEIRKGAAMQESVNVSVNKKIVNQSRKEKGQKSRKSIILKADLLNKITEIQEFCTSQEYPVKPKVADVLSASFPDLKESDYRRIYKSLLSPEDRLNIEHQKYNKENEVDITLTEFVCLKLKL